MNDFLKRLDDLLHEQGRKRPWLAEETGIGLSTINNWFSKNRYPMVNTALKIARALGVSIDYLMTGEEPGLTFEDPLMKEIYRYLETLTHAELNEVWGMIKLAKAMRLDDKSGKRRTS